MSAALFVLANTLCGLAGLGVVALVWCAWRNRS